MLSDETIKFIIYLTGNSKKTIKAAYNNWLRIKDDEDYKEFHPNHIELFDDDNPDYIRQSQEEI